MMATDPATSRAVLAREPVPLFGYALFGAMLAAAGLPIYIHAPNVYATEYGVGLGVLGAVLFGLRLFDLVQDPALGWLAARLGRRRGPSVALSGVLMAVAMFGLFAVPPPIAPVLWFAVMLTLLFTAYSFLSIAFYALGIERALRLGLGGHFRLAGWREGGAFAGVTLAAMAPAVLLFVTDRPYALFAAGFGVLVLIAVAALNREWGVVPARSRPSGFRMVLADRPARRLLFLAAVNAAPLAVTATLFLFFVQSRLDAPGWEGPLLILFFLAAAAAAPLWSRAALRFGPRPVLLLAMVAAIVAFAFAATLGPGDVLPFALVCVASGAMLGADTVLLPALFARRVSQIALDRDGSEGFALWSFASKLTLAFAAVLLLPLLERAGFVPGGANPPAALAMLTLLYALLPCALKLVAIALLFATPLPED
jgi:GPH family glycoside/pentoside/hexuronide:cation symporter